MLETSARLLRLLSLFQGRRCWSGADLAGRLEVTCRTLRRDVDKLRTLGYPIHSTSGAEGGYQLGAGAEMPPLLLDDDEAVAVALGLRYAATGSVEGVEEASVRALLKIEQILPPRLGRRVAALQSVVVSPAGTGSAVEARTLSTIAGACRDREMLRFRYRDRAGTATARSVVAAPSGKHLAALVSGGVGYRAQGLADLSRGPHGAAVDGDGRPLRPARNRRRAIWPPTSRGPESPRDAVRA